MAPLDNLRAALKSQAGPLAHVETAHGEAWGIVHARSLAGGTPPGAWQKTRALLENSRPLLKRHRETLEQHEVGIDRAAKLEGEQQAGYLGKMSEHFAHRVRELDQFKEELLDVSGVVGSEPTPEAELQRVDTLLTLMGYAAGDLARQASEYQQDLTGPAGLERQDDLIGDLIAAPAMGVGTAIDTTVETVGDTGVSLWGGERTPALVGAGQSGLHGDIHGDRVAFYRDNYGVEMRFEADGRPILDPIGDLSRTLPQRGLGLGLEAPSLNHGDHQAY